ncbi:MAG: hypothetical protein GX957_01455, partial [Clostridiaceae bacterium]|nr:hypothetical protein [Clostridiaceae bacterium]
MTKRKKALLKKLMAFILVTIIVVSANVGALNVFAASGLLKPMLIVDMTDVESDIEVFVNFESISGGVLEENVDIYIKNSSFGTGDTENWDIEIEGGTVVV